jgi:[protein-PII] uridylyltransferase
VLWRGSVALPALAELDDVGLLTATIPEWRPVRGRPQRNPYHRYALDRHAWHTVAALGDLVRRVGWAGVVAACLRAPHAGQKFASSPIGEPH